MMIVPWSSSSLSRQTLRPALTSHSQVARPWAQLVDRTFARRPAVRRRAGSVDRGQSRRGHPAAGRLSRGAWEQAARTDLSRVVFVDPSACAPARLEALEREGAPVERPRVVGEQEEPRGRDAVAGREHLERQERENVQQDLGGQLGRHLNGGGAKGLCAVLKRRLEMGSEGEQQQRARWAEPVPFLTGCRRRPRPRPSLPSLDGPSASRPLAMAGQPSRALPSLARSPSPSSSSEGEPSRGAAVGDPRNSPTTPPLELFKMMRKLNTSSSSSSSSSSSFGPPGRRSESDAGSEMTGSAEGNWIWLALVRPVSSTSPFPRRLASLTPSRPASSRSRSRQLRAKLEHTDEMAAFLKGAWPARALVLAPAEDDGC